MTVELIIDESCVESTQGISFRLSQASKHPDNPVLIPGYPHEWDSLQVN